MRCVGAYSSSCILQRPAAPALPALPALPTPPRCHCYCHRRPATTACRCLPLPGASTSPIRCAAAPLLARPLRRAKPSSVSVACASQPKQRASCIPEPAALVRRRVSAVPRAQTHPPPAAAALLVSAVHSALRPRPRRLPLRLRPRLRTTHDPLHVPVLASNHASPSQPSPTTLIAPSPSRCPRLTLRQNSSSPRGPHIPAGRPTAQQRLRSLRQRPAPTPANLHRPAGRIPRARRLPHHPAAARPPRPQDVHPQHQVDVGLHPHRRHTGRRGPDPRGVRRTSPPTASPVLTNPQLRLRPLPERAAL